MNLCLQVIHLPPIFLQAILEKGVFAFGAAADQDFRFSLPMKFLAFNFSIFILIVISFYTANLAAILSQAENSIRKIDLESIISDNIPICAHPFIKNDL